MLQRRPVQAGGISFDTVMLGDGSPTVVFANGLGTPLEEWTLVAPTIAKRCRIVCYERRSAGVHSAHDTAEMAADLRQLLDALDVNGPLLLVGHSWGGAVIRRFAVDHPNDVAGMVFVDASHERIRGVIPNRATRALYALSTLALRVGPIRRRLLRMLGFDRLPEGALTAVDNLPWRANGRTARAEFAAIGSSCDELSRIAPDLPHVPTRVLIAGGRGRAAKLGAKQLARIRSVWEQAVAGRDEIALRSVPDSGHYISLDQPQAVIDAIDDVLGQIR